MRPGRSAVGGIAADERGSSPVEFVLVGALITFVTLAVIQFGLAVYVRGLAHDAALEGAFHAALADVDDRAGADRAREIVVRTVGADFVHSAEVSTTARPYPAIEVTLRLTFPVVGLVGVPGGWEVSAHAPLETFD